MRQHTELSSVFSALMVIVSSSCNSCTKLIIAWKRLKASPTSTLHVGGIHIVLASDVPSSSCIHMSNSYLIMLWCERRIKVTFISFNRRSFPPYFRPTKLIWHVPAPLRPNTPVVSWVLKLSLLLMNDLMTLKKKLIK